jgi:hypothetical protein
MKCPSCACAADDDAAECPGCGLIFAKWRERQAKEKAAALAALAALEAPAPALLLANPWIVRGVAAAVVGVWISVLGVYVFHHTRKRGASIGDDTGTSVKFRDPRTGAMREMPIRSIGVSAGPSTVPANPAPASSEQ